MTHSTPFARMVESLGLNPTSNLDMVGLMVDSLVKSGGNVPHAKDFVSFQVYVSGLNQDAFISLLMDTLVDPVDISNPSQKHCHMASVTVLAACFIGSMFGICPQPKNGNWPNELFSNWGTATRVPKIVKNRLDDLLSKASRAMNKEADPMEGMGFGS